VLQGPHDLEWVKIRGIQGDTGIARTKWDCLCFPFLFVKQKFFT
jgi:hypothetical protein